MIRQGREFKWSGYLWENAAAADVADFLARYRTHPDAHKVNSALLSEFINGMAAQGELTRWTVALIGASGAPDERIFHVTPELPLRMIQRKRGPSEGSGYAIGRLLSPRDESIGVDEKSWIAALELTREAWRRDPARYDRTTEPDSPGGVALRRIRGIDARDHGLLLLYVLDPLYEDAELPAGTPPVVAFGISFPGSDSGVKVEYKVNNVLWEQEYGSPD
jgi:hypothetical protein